MKKDHPYIGVDAIILDEDERVLLIRRSNSSQTYPGYWALVGGWVEWGETAHDALMCEVREEIGVEIEEIMFIGSYFDTPHRHPTKTSFALPHFCKISSGEPSVHQPEEIQEVRWFSEEEIVALDMAYDHKDMLRAAGII